jgi:hypothetical protein
MNTIIFGGENSNKTVHALNMIREHSPSKLKYKRKIELEVNGENYYFNISDIHFEIDFELLGTNETSIWNEFINHVFFIIETKSKSSNVNYIILCKNIHTMKDELLQIFYTFIRNKNISFIFTTQHVSFLPSTLKNKCQIIHLKKEKTDYSTQYIIHCDEIIEFIKEKKDDLFLLRELLYNLLTYNCNMHSCFYYIYSSLLRSGHIKTDKIDELIEIIKKYNTNYRPIYHLESFVICMLLNN